MSTIIHAQRADAAGDTQVWGLLGCQKEAAFAAERVIVVVEELVDEEVIRADPNRTILPGLDRRRRRGRAVRRPSRPTPRATTTATTRSTSSGTRSAATRSRSTRGSTSGSTACADRREYLAKLGEERPCGAAASAGAVRARSTTATTDDRHGCRRPAAVQPLRDDDRRRGARAGRAARLLRGRRAAEHRGQPRQAHRRAGPGAGLRGGRLRRPAGTPAAVASATRRSSPARPRSRACSSCSATTCRAG